LNLERCYDSTRCASRPTLPPRSRMETYGVPRSCLPITPLTDIQPGWRKRATRRRDRFMEYNTKAVHQIEADIARGALKDEMWQQELIASGSLREAIFASPMNQHAKVCPNAPQVQRPPLSRLTRSRCKVHQRLNHVQGRLSPVEDEWSSGRGEPVDRLDYGFASQTSSTCRLR